MEKPKFDHPYDPEGEEIDTLKEKNDSEGQNEQIRKFIEELKRGLSPEEAALHSSNFRNTVKNYRIEKMRHKNA